MIFNVFDIIKEIVIQPVIPHFPVVAFHIRVLLRIIQLDSHDLNAFAYSLGFQQTAYVF